MSGPVDVLAVMEGIVPNTRFSAFTGDDLDEARAAVAELIEAASEMRRAVDDETAALEAFRKGSDTLETKAAESRVVEASARLATSLARCRGEA